MIVALAALLACGREGEQVAPPTLTAAAERVTLGTVRDLGPCIVRGTLRRETAGPGITRASEETSELRWQDPDNWSWVRTRDGRAVEETRVWDAVAWTRTGDRDFARKGDAEPYRVQLASVWDPWASLESFARQVVLTPGEVEELEGRRVVRHVASLAPPPERPRRGWTVDSVDGTVWIDEATALRLQGDVTLAARDGDLRQTLHLAFSVSAIGGDPGLTPPPGAAAAPPKAASDGDEP